MSRRNMMTMRMSVTAFIGMRIFNILSDSRGWNMGKKKDVPWRQQTLMGKNTLETPFLTCRIGRSGSRRKIRFLQKVA